MAESQSGKMPIMPLSDPSYWQDLWKVIAGGLVTLGGFFGAIWTWANDRFKRVESRVDDVEAENAEQNVEIATLKAEAHNAHEDRVEIKQKLDKLIDMQMARNG